MVEVKTEIKDDKMTEPKYDKKEYAPCSFKFLRTFSVADSLSSIVDSANLFHPTDVNS